MNREEVLKLIKKYRRTYADPKYGKKAFSRIIEDMFMGSYDMKILKESIDPTNSLILRLHLTKLLHEIIDNTENKCKTYVTNGRVYKIDRRNIN